MKLSVITTIYNEEESLPGLIKRLESVCKNYSSYEIICVDDGSTDGSIEVLQKEKSHCPAIKIIKLVKNCGKSEGLAAGFKHAQGEIVVTIDADLQDPPEEIPKLIDALEGVDMVTGWRYPRQDSLATRWAGQFANGFRRFLLHDQTHDTGCSLKVFRREMLAKITIHRGMHRFLSALVLIAGGKIKEIKTKHCKRLYGQSKTNTFLRAIPAFFDLLAVIWMRKRKLRYNVEEIL